MAFSRSVRWTVIAVVAVASGSCRAREPLSNDAAWSLLKRACPHPPVSGRLFEFSSASPAVNAGVSHWCQSVDARLAAAVLQRDAEVADVPEIQRRAGVSRLVSGDVEGSIVVLNAAVATSRTDGPAWNDLAAAYLTRAADHASALDAVRALNAASNAATLKPFAQEAAANRSQALARLGLSSDGEVTREARVRQLAADAFLAPLASAALARDRDLMVEVVERHWLRDWAAAVVANKTTLARQIQFVTIPAANAISISGGDASVTALATELMGAAASVRRSNATAWLGYLSAVDAWEADDVGLADRTLRSVRRTLTAVGPAADARAILLLATIDRVQGETVDALRAVRSPTSQAFEAFPVLDARRRRQFGLLLDEAGDLGRALTKYQEALRTFERAGDRESASLVSALLATAYLDMEDLERSWSYQVSANRGRPFSRRIHRELIDASAAMLASAAGLHAAATVLRGRAIDESRAAGASLSLAFLLADEAIDLNRVGRHAEALRTLDEASELIDTVPDGGSRDMIRALYAMTMGSVVSITKPEQAEKLFAEAVNIYRERGNEFATAESQLKRGRLLLRLGKVAQAGSVFRDGLMVAQRQERSVQSRRDSAALRAARWALYQELANVQIDQHQPWKALDMIEDARGLSSPRWTQAPSRAAQPTPPQGALLISYVVLPSRLAAWAIAPGFRTTFLIDIEPAALADLVERYRTALRQGSNPTKENDRLFDLLLGPLRTPIAASNLLVVVADGAIHDLPFSTLRDPATKQLLVERTAVIMSPSLQYSLEPRTQGLCGHCTDVVFANPARMTSSPDYSPLPFSEDEAASIAKIYRGTTLVTGSAATRERLFHMVASARMFHFAGHAVPNTSRPDLSRLVVAPSDTDIEGAVFAADIEKLTLSARLVVLAACDTATGTVRPGPGMMGLARAFMTAGVPFVIATVWPVDDREASLFFVELHRQLARGLEAPQAVRAAQLKSHANGNNAALWGAVVAMGTIPRALNGR